MPGLPELDQQLGALRRLAHPELEGDLQPLCGVVEGQRGGRGPSGVDVVGDAARAAGQWRGGGEVVGELGCAPRPARFQRLADAQVQLRAAQPGKPVVEGAPDELVREAVLQPQRRQLLDHAAAHGLLERAEEVRLAGTRDGAQNVQPNSEPAAAELQQVARLRSQPASRPPTTSRTLSGVPSSASGRTSRSSPSTTRTTFVSTSARHSSQTRKALPAVRSLIVRRELGDVGAPPPARRTKSPTSSPERPGSRRRTTSSERRRSASVSDSPSGTSASRKVTRQQEPRPPARPRQMAEQAERGRVGPMRVLEHQQHGTVVAHRRQQVRHGRVQAMADGVRVGLVARRRVAKVGDQPRELAAGRSEGSAKLGGIEHPGELLERLDERAVGRATDRVAGAVEDERAVRGRLGGELAHQAALAGARLTARTATRRAAPAVGSSSRSVASSLSRPTNGNAEGRQSGPGRSALTARR